MKMNEYEQVAIDKDYGRAVYLLEHDCPQAYLAHSYLQTRLAPWSCSVSSWSVGVQSELEYRRRCKEWM